MRLLRFVELMLVILIVAIMAAILFPIFAKVRGGDTHRTCQSKLKQIGLGLVEYAQDNDGCLPAVSDRTGRYSWRTALQPYTKTDGLYLCPSRPSVADVRKGTFGSDGFPISYAANTAGVSRSGPGRGPFAPSAKPGALNGIDDLPGTIAVCEVQKTASAGFDIDDPFFGPSRQVLYAGHRGGSNYMFCDGHVKMLYPADTDAARVGAAPENMWYSGSKRPLSQNGQEILKRTATVFPVTAN